MIRINLLPEAKSRVKQQEASRRYRLRHKNDPEYKAKNRAAAKAYQARFPNYRIHKSLQYRTENPIGEMLYRAKIRAKRRGLEFTIKSSDVEIPDRCPLLGMPLYSKLTSGTGRGSGRTLPNSPSLDRIDSSKGYIPGNVWVISHRANTIKNDASIDELEAVAQGLRQRLGYE